MVRRSALRAASPWLRLLRLHAQFLLFLFLDDDAGGDHHHQALGFAPDGRVLEEPVEVRNLIKHGHAGLGASFAQSLDAAQQDGAAVRHANGRGHGDKGEGGQLNGGAGIRARRVVSGLIPELGGIGGVRLNARPRGIGRGARRAGELEGVDGAIVLKKGTTVKRTKRLSLETTA